MKRFTTDFVFRTVGAAIIAVGAVACKERVRLAERDVRIASPPVVLHFPAPYRAVGPTRELCLEPASERDADAIAPYGTATQATPLVAVMIGPAGERDTLGDSGFDASWMPRPGHRMPPSIDIHGATVCLWDHGLSNPENAKLVREVYDSSGQILAVLAPERPLPPLTATYVGVELRSKVPTRIREASFWSGQRMAFP